jgi:AcrR family transcriptional regulator
MAATPSPAPRWQRLERDERREQILDCARRLFSERSYATVSTSEIAAEAGVARGLLHHYFGTKRELYLEVVRSLLRVPATPIPRADDGRGLEASIGDAVDRWLEMVERNQGMWLAAIGAQGLGIDPEVKEIVNDARERAAARLIDALGEGGAACAPGPLKAIVRAYGGMAEEASVEWLERGRLTREQVHALLVQGFLESVGAIRAAVDAA